jgi:alpha-1,6-mannosyltransferase
MEGLQRQALGYPVTFAGHVADRAEVARLLASADVTLAPCRAEAFGLVVLESLASGTPVVTSDAGAAFEVCGPTCGVAAPNDATAMADAVSRILERDRLGTRLASRARAEEFSWSATAESVLALHFGREREGANA